MVNILVAAVFAATSPVPEAARAAPQPIVAEIREHAGAPALWVDGKPVQGLMHWNRWPTAEDVRVFAAAGVHLYSFMGAPAMENPSGEKTDYGDGLAKQPILTDDFIEKTMATIVAADPEAKVLVRFRLTTPDWWRKAHPDETVKVYDWDSRTHRSMPWATPSSPSWRALVDASVRRLVRLFETKWPDRVIGYHPGLVCCAENAYQWGIGLADFSPVHLKRFSGKVPDPEVYFSRSLGDTRRLLDPVKEADAIAFLRFQAEEMASDVCWLSHIVKDELKKLGHVKVCGAFYGYANLPANQTDLMTSGHAAHEAVLASPDIDFIAAPIDYSSRQPGGATLAQALPGSIAAHGKLYWAEEDTRFHLATGHGDRVSGSAAETRQLLRRNFLDAYSHGGAIWWMDLFGEGWYREASFTDAVRECRDFAAAHPDRRSVAEIAVFVHEMSLYCERVAPILLSSELTAPLLSEVASCGAPHDVYRLADLPQLEARGLLKQYRLAVVANAHSVDGALRETIRRTLCRDGRTVVWVGIPGYIRGADAGAPISTELTGIAVDTRYCNPYANTVETFVGGRRLSFGAVRQSNPQLVVCDKAATDLAWFVQGQGRYVPGGMRAVAVAKKRMDGWTSVVSLVNALPSELVRVLAEEAGVHVYSPHGDQVFTGSGWFAVAAKMSGRHTLSAPWQKEPVIADMKRGECRIFSRRESARTVMNVVNFVRGCEPRDPKLDLVRPIAEEIALNTKYHLPNTILLQYDALIRPDLMKVVRSAEQDRTEYGVWIEMARQLVEKCGMKWRGRKGWDWDWYINPGFLMAYTHEERAKIIDEIFRLFKAEFGTYPKSVGSWLLDAWSMDYMQKKYDVKGFCICREQDNTDAYGLRGGYFNGLYYPSRKNMLSAAVDMKNAVKAPVFKMLTPDPIYNYAKSVKPNAKEFGTVPSTLEPVWYSGFTKSVIDWYFRVYTGPGRLGLSYMQTGQENSFGWERIGRGLPYQIEQIARLRDEGKLDVEKMCDTAERFIREHGENCPQTQVALEDWGGDHKSVWYNSKHYRANLLLDGETLRFRDIHKMCDDFEEPFLDKVCTGWQALYFTPPVVDEYLFKTDGRFKPWTIAGKFREVSVATPDAETLVATAKRADGGADVTVTFKPGRIVVKGDSAFLTERKTGVETIEFDGFRYRVGFARSAGTVEIVLTD